MDIVIPLKRALMNEELRYTLCSIDKNVPHRIVWLVGYDPAWVKKTVGRITAQVPYGSKYAKAANNILTACRDDRVTEDFILFNDDFFVMKPVEKIEPLHRGKLIDYAKKFEDEGLDGVYYQGLIETHKALQELGVEEPLNYGLHVPMVINKQKWLEMWAKRQEFPAKRLHLRTFYGNLHKIGGRQIEDVKISGNDVVPTGEELFLSTNDTSYASGKVGEYIREQFPRGTCKYV